VIGYILLMGFTYLSILLAAIFGIPSPFTLVALVTLTVALRAISVARAHYDEYLGLVPANVAIVFIHLRPASCSRQRISSIRQFDPSCDSCAARVSTRFDFLGILGASAHSSLSAERGHLLRSPGQIGATREDAIEST
jgi:hypothetical protein